MLMAFYHTGTAQCTAAVVFFFKVMTYAILLISPGHWLQAKSQQPIGVVSLVILFMAMPKPYS